MAQEDDLRALGKIMDFMRGISVLFLLINCYWFCYSAFTSWHFTLGIIDKILLNFQRTTGLFSSMLWTKLFSVVFLGLSCLGTKGVKEEKITWGMIYSALAVGFVLFFLNWWVLALPISAVGAASLYIFSLSLGYICLLMAGVWMSRLLKNNLMDDVFNMENESFMQETRLMQNEYSVNLPTRFYYKKKWHKGCQGRKDNVGNDLLSPCRGLCAFLSQLVCLVLAHLSSRCSITLHLLFVPRLYLPTDGWRVDESFAQKQPDG